MNRSVNRRLGPLWPLSFTFPILNVMFNPSECSTSTLTNVTLNGLYHVTVHTTRNPNGTYTGRFLSQAHGTAVDNNGGTYVFNYNNHERDVSSSPAIVPPILGTVTDRFGLIGQGRTPNLSYSFRIVYSIDAQGNFTVISIQEGGNSSCAPI